MLFLGVCPLQRKLKTRDPSERPTWKVVHQELYEQQCLIAIESPHYSTEAIFQLLEATEDWLQYDPRSRGTPLKFDRDRDFWVHETARSGFRPGFRLFYEIIEIDKEVLLWKCTFS